MTKPPPETPKTTTATKDEAIAMLKQSFSRIGPGQTKPRRQELLSVERLLYARAVLLLLPKAKATTRLRTPSARWMRLSATL